MAEWAAVPAVESLFCSQRDAVEGKGHEVRITTGVAGADARLASTSELVAAGQLAEGARRLAVLPG
jgi:hypothetical protein